MAVRERRGTSVVLKVSTEMPCPEDAMRERTGLMEKVASAGAPRTRGPVCGSLNQWVWNLISSCLCLFYHLVASSPLSLWAIFFGRYHHPLMMIVQQLAAILVLL